MIDTGKMLLDYITAKKLLKIELGKMIGRNGLSVLQYTRRQSMQTQMLLKICHATKHNFFRDIADQLPDDYTITKPVDNSQSIEKDEIIAQLQEENKVLKIQNDVLMKVRG